MLLLKRMRSPSRSPASGGGAHSNGRGPAATPPRPARKARSRPPRLLRGPRPVGMVVLAGFCVLATCALALPGFVQGAGRPALDQDRQASPGLAPEPGLDRGTVTTKTPVTVPTVVPTTVPTMSANQVKRGDVTADLPPEGEWLVTLPWGSGPGEVGLAKAAEGLTRGPEALAVAPDGRIAVLDSVNGRLMLLDPTGKPIGTTDIPLSVPRFLAVDADRLHVLDCDADRRLITFDWSGMELGAVVLPDLNDVVTGLFATDQGPCVEVSHETVLLLAPEGVAVQSNGDPGVLEGSTEVDAQAMEAGPVVATEVSGLDESTSRQPTPARATVRSLAGRPTSRGLDRVAEVTFRPGRSVHINLLDLDAKTLEPWQVSESSPSLAGGLEIEHLVSVDGDGARGLIVGARLLNSKVADQREASLVLTRLVRTQSGDPSAGSSAASPAGSAAGSASGALKATGSLFLTDSPFAYLGQPYVVSPDGRIFQPWGSEAGYCILVYSFAQPKEVR